MQQNLRGPSPASAKDVAADAHVSVTTVSRVLNGRADAIPAETQRRVIEAASRLGYRPNSLAVALRSGVTETLGLVVPDIGDAYFHQVARGVEDVAQPRGYGVLLANTDRDPVREQAVVGMLLGKHVDGLIFAGGGVGGDDHLRDIAWGRTRVVTVGPHAIDFPSVSVDDSNALEDAVDHLVEIGRRRILCLAGQPDWLVSQARLTGYQRAVQKHNLDDEPALTIFGDFTRSSGYQRTAEALASGPQFDGVVAFNDYCAIGALAALDDAGVKVPDEVAVIGCDDISEAQLCRPKLSSISFSQYDLGKTAATVLLEERADEPPVQPHTLTVRGSTVLPESRPKPTPDGLTGNAITP